MKPDNHNQELKSIISPRLFGRSSDLDRLAHLQDLAFKREGRSVLITGEAGIGKTRLVAEAKIQAAKVDTQILSGQCFELDGLVPYAPILEILRTWIAEQPVKQLPGLLGPFAPEFCKLLPELVYQLPEVHPSPSLDAVEEKQRAFETLSQFFGKMSDEKPLLIVCEDLHWSDDTSLEFLSHLARRLRTKPALMIMTYRSDEIRPGLARFLAGLDRERLAEEISLQPLTESQVAEMVKEIFNLPRPVEGMFIDTLVEMTDGNPFFIEEVLKSLVISGDIYYIRNGWIRKPIDRQHIPRSIQVAVQERLNGLSNESRELLRLASVVGRRFDLRLLQAILGTDEARLLPLLRELVAAQLVVEETEVGFAFRHALTRNAIYYTMLSLERKPYHQKVANSLEQMFAGRLKIVLSDLADHSFQAGDWERTLKYAGQAAADAQRLYSLPAVIVQSTRALEAAELLSITPPLWIYRACGQSRELLGDFDGAQADYENMLDLGRSSGDRKLEWQALLDLGLLWASRDYGKTGRYYQDALELADKIEAPDILAHTLNRVGNWHMNLGRLNEAIRFYREALTIFEKLADHRGKAQTLEMLGMATGQAGDPESIEYHDRAIELSYQLDDRYSLASALSMRGFLTVIFSGNDPVAPDRDRVLQDLETATQIARETGWQSGEAFTLLQSSQVFALFGDYRTALSRAWESARIANEIEHRQWIAGSQITLGMIHLELLAFTEARRLLEQGLAIGREIGSLIWITLAAAHLSTALSYLGEPDQAEAILDQACPATSIESYYQGMCACSRARVALSRNQPEKALSILDLLSDTAPHLLRQFRRYPSNPSLLRAEALSILGQDAAAEAVLKVEQEFAQTRKISTIAWRVYLALGKLHRRNRLYSEAEIEFQAAREHVESIANQVPDEDLRKEFLSNATVLIPTPLAHTARQAAKLEYDGLTEREREVAALIASGKSNHQISLELSISERTTATHVGNILKKLSFTSRSQIAAWAVERGIYSSEKETSEN